MDSDFNIDSPLKQVIDEWGDKLSFCALDLKTGVQFSHNAEVRVPTASVIKLPILCAAMQAMKEGALKLETRLTLRDEVKVIGAGVLQHLDAELQMSLRDVLTLMIILSDNTATNMVIDLLGLQEFNERFITLGMTQTTLHKRVFIFTDPSSENSEKFGLGATTALEMSNLLKRINEKELLGEPWDSQIYSMLSKQEYRNGIPRYLSPECSYAGKTGSVTGVRNDVGIVKHPDGHQFALSIFVHDTPYVEDTPDNPAQLAVAQIAKLLSDALLASKMKKD